MWPPDLNRRRCFPSESTPARKQQSFGYGLARGVNVRLRPGTEILHNVRHHASPGCLPA